jgi:hypothetical protein
MYQCVGLVLAHHFLFIFNSKIILLLALEQWYSTFFYSRIPICNFSSTLCPPKLMVYNSSYTQSIICI